MREKETTITDQKIEKKVIENRWDRALIVLACFLLFISSVLTGVSVWQGTQRNKRITHIDLVVSEAKEAALSSERAVNKAIAPSQTPEGKAQTRAFIAALTEIKDIKTMVEEIRIALLNK